MPGPHADVTVRDFPGPLRDGAGALRGGSASVCRGTRRSATTMRSSRATAPAPTSARFGTTARRRSTRPSTLSFAAASSRAGCRRASSPDRLPATTRSSTLDEPQPVVVPPDPRRCYVAKDRPQALAGAVQHGRLDRAAQPHGRRAGGPRLRAVRARVARLATGGRGRPRATTTATTRSSRDQASGSSCSTRSPTSARPSPSARRARSTIASTAGSTSEIDRRGDRG